MALLACLTLEEVLEFDLRAFRAHFPRVTVVVFERHVSMLALSHDRLLVGGSIEATSQEGVSTVTTARIWGKKAALLYLPSGAMLKNPAFGYTFVHSDTDFLTETWLNGDGATSDAVRTRIAATPEILASQAGYLYSDVVA